MRNLLDKGVGAAMLAACAFAAFVSPQSASAQMFLAKPDFKPGPITGSDPLVGLPIPGATPAEYQAHLLWNLRSGLNVAALQCQFSPFLRAVDNYNGILAHHAVELAAAYKVLSGYFKRVNGAKGLKLFDDYSTMTYNGFSTLQAQYGFCQVATNIAKQALATPKGQLHVTAGARMRELRNSLVPAYERGPVYNPHMIRFTQPPAPPLRAECWNKKGRYLSKKCGAAV
ncbi:hypothetical protein [Sphingosinicella rhizophila]|uniref:Uncharacterized protein n=1 Tax=Sphingosinicella rhizophila TaxID=3050082 RepID=A0ABU3Q8X0_9SPHN|nr:hypothetical protein [Sphingosinicella sp. GR2756]MDT9599846.1 hypothetical protein [Sphingosinicella sp. GR2756]